MVRQKKRGAGYCKFENGKMVKWYDEKKGYRRSKMVKW